MNEDLQSIGAGEAYQQRTRQVFSLQRFVFPDESRSDRLALYARWLQGRIRLATKLGLPIEPGTKIDFCTFFNALSHRKWRSVAGLQTLGLRLAGRGRVQLIIYCSTETFAAWPILEKEVNLEYEPIIEITDTKYLAGEVLFIELSGLEGAAEPSLLRSAEWITWDLPKREVHLAAVVTTFRRESAAWAAMRRFSEETIPGVPYGSLHLFVIDNGQTLVGRPPPGVTVLPNRNLGGAGGFARGLIEAQDAGRFTHALFMDDDAACEPESVWRTMALLSFHFDPTVAVAGAMLLEHHPWIQHEKGAQFRLLSDRNQHNTENKKFLFSALVPNFRNLAVFCALGHGKDLSAPWNVVSNELGPSPNYGGWWFFAFSLSSTRHFPFPFFVRGDDVDFCISNGFSIETLNGIATWCPDFGFKLNPRTEYLAWRAWLGLTYSYGAPIQIFSVLLHAAFISLRCGFRFDYASMNAVAEALYTASQGPLAFANDPSPLSTLASLKKVGWSRPPRDKDLGSAVGLWYASRLWRVLGYFSLGGHIFALRRKKGVPLAWLPWHVSVAHSVRTPAFLIGMRNEILLHEKDRATFFKIFVKLMGYLWRALYVAPSVSKQYKALHADFRSRKYWEAALGLKDRKAIDRYGDRVA